MKSDAVDKILRQWHEERPDLDASPLDILSRVFRLSKKWQQEVSSILQEFEIEYWEFDVIVSLLRHGRPYELSAAELARACLSSFGAMTNRIDRMAKRNLVQRKTDPDDRRKVIIALTSKGKLIAGKASEKRFELGRHDLEALTASEKKTLSTLLRKLMD
jgi:DNA-binding MarR family transcriptional regulator